MAKVIVVSSTFVPPASPTPANSLWLSNLDLYAAPTHVRTVYFFRRPAIADESYSPSPLAVIKSSLARVLVPYYPIAGRLGQDPDGRREIKCTGEGALFYEAVSELTLDEFGVYTPSVENRRLLVPTDGLDTMEKDDHTIPILLVQVTTFRCGGVCLGVGLHHQVADGIAAMHFISAWAAAARDSAAVIPTPFLDRTLLRARSPPSVCFLHPEFDLRQAPKEKKPTSFAYLNLSGAQIAAVKSSCGGRCSTYEAVTAHLWRCACLARGLADSDEEVRLLMTADARRRLRPPLPDLYIGDAIVTTVAIAPAREISSPTSTPPAVARIRAALAKLDDEYLRSAVDFLEMQEDKRRLARSAGNFSATDMSVTSWTKMAVYDADFGWGPPEFMGHAAFFYSRQFSVLPGPDGVGVRVGFSLETEIMETFVKLFYELVPSSKASIALSDGKALATSRSLLMRS